MTKIIIVKICQDKGENASIEGCRDAKKSRRWKKNCKKTLYFLSFVKDLLIFFVLTEG